MGRTGFSLSRRAFSRRGGLPRLLEQMEVHFDGCRRHHRLSVAGARTEAPLLHRLDGLLLKPESQPPRHRASPRLAAWLCALLRRIPAPLGKAPWERWTPLRILAVRRADHPVHV